MRKSEVERLLADRGGSGIKDWITSTQDVRTQLPVAAGELSNRAVTVARAIVGAHSGRAWRITLGPLAFFANAVTPPLGSTPCIARVVWGWDTARFSAEVDWPAAGTHFNIWADSVEITLVVPDTYQTDPVLPASSPETRVQGAAIIVPQASAGGPQPTRTFYTGTLVAGAFSAPIPVPAEAVAFRWHQLINTSAGNTPIGLFFAGTQDAGLLYTTFTTPNGVYTTSETTWPSDDGITLQPSTRFLVVQNTDLLDSVSLQLEFVLDLE